MKINGNEIRPGNVIRHKDSIWVAVKISHVKPGKGGAFAQVELKKATDGTKLNERFRSSETVERLRLDSKRYQFLYLDDNQAHFMDQETYEQIQISLNRLDDKSAFLQEGIELEIESYEDEPINIVFPENISLEVSETEPTVKGQTAASSYKPAQLENGCLLYTSPSPRDAHESRMPSSA